MKQYPFLEIVVSVVVVAAAGCASQQTRANRAFESEKWGEAYSRYEETIDQGTSDWKVYYRAAQAATHLGNFSKAERYYGRALRNGGGTQVARKFADFYLQTSNYSQAVRLLQFLLETEEGNKQSLYNNLGTALMYSGSPLDAESYLQIAQQLAPKDPIPYVNLGVLYDRHLQQRRLAADFYECYLKLANEQGSQQQRIRSRLSRISTPRSRGGGGGVECGKPYSPGSRRVADLEKKMEEMGGGAPGEGTGTDGDKKPIDLNFGDESEDSGNDRSGGESGSGEGGETDAEKYPAPSGSFEGMDDDDPGSEAKRPATDADTSGETEPRGLSIERAGESPSDTSSSDTNKRESGSSTDESGASVDQRAVLERAKMAYENKDYQRVVGEISALSVGDMSVEAMRIHGLALYELAENEKARQWLEWVVQRKPDAEVVGALLMVYERLDQEQDRKQVCRKFRSRDGYGDVTESCPTPAQELDKETLEKLKKQRQNR
jgi:Flp pilus assembly protein TadD